MLAERIGIIAGGDDQPLLIARSAVARGEEVYLAAFKGLVDPALKQLADAWIDVGLAQPGRVIRFFKKQGVTRAVFCGRIDKDVIYSNTKFLEHIPDLRALRMWYSLANRQDTTILATAADEFAREGIEIVSPLRYLDHLLAGEGVLTKRAPTEREQGDIAFGAGIARTLAGLEIGQSIIVKSRNVVAVEAMEGTDATIRRGGDTARGGAVLVKFSRPDQDRRFDIPGTGLDTVGACADAGVSVMALEAGAVLMYHPDAMIAAADRAGIAIVGVTAEEEPA